MSKKLKLVELGDRILRTKAKAVAPQEILTKEFQKFARDLIKMCDESEGVGIASPQVGVAKRVFILWSRMTKKRKNVRAPRVPDLGPLTIVNPKIVQTSKSLVKGWEGCLSIPGIRGLVPRYKSIDVEFTNEKGEKIKMKFSDFPARIFQHEFDHLNGVVFLDRTDPKDLVTEREYKDRKSVV